MEVVFHSTDGTGLFGERYAPNTTVRGAALVAHGYDDNAARYGELCLKLANNGFHVLAFDYRGHGRAGGRRGHCQRFEDYLADLDCARRELARHTGGLPMVLAGHSHGALVALRWLSDHSRAHVFSAAVLSSPFLGLAMRVGRAKAALAALMSRLMPTLSLKSGLDPAMLSHDPERVECARRDRFRHGVATARWFTEMQAAQAFVTSQIHRVSVPSLWLVGGHDPIVDTDATRRAFALAGGDKKIIWYDGFFHEVFNEVGRERVFADLEAWLSSRFELA